MSYSSTYNTLHQCYNNQWFSR